MLSPLWRIQHRSGDVKEASDSMGCWAHQRRRHYKTPIPSATISSVSFSVTILSWNNAVPCTDLWLPMTLELSILPPIKQNNVVFRVSLWTGLPSFFLRIFETWDPANCNMLAVSWLVYVYIYIHTHHHQSKLKNSKKNFRNQSVYRVFWESSSLKPKTISRAPLLWAGLQWTDAVPWLWKKVTHPPVIKHGNGSPPIFIHSHIICRWCSDENKETSHTSRC